MGFNMTNVSNNPQQLSDGKLLAPGDSRKLKAVGERDQKLANRGWLSITEEVVEKKEESAGGKK